MRIRHSGLLRTVSAAALGLALALPVPLAFAQLEIDGFQVQLVNEGEDPEADEGEEDEDAEETSLSADLQKKLEELAPRASEKALKTLERAGRKSVLRLAKELGLDAEQQKKLEAVVPPAVAEARKRWEEKFLQQVRPLLQRNTNPQKYLETVEKQLQSWGNRVYPATTPDTTEAWKKGVAEALPAELLAKFETSRKEKREAFLKENKDWFAMNEDQAKAVFETALESKRTEIEEVATLDDDKKARLKIAGENAVKAAVAGWRERAEKLILEMDAANRAELLTNRSSIGVDTSQPEYRAEEQQVWKDAVKDLLNAEQRKQLASMKKARRNARCEVLAMVLVMEMDRMVGFSEEQRAKVAALIAPKLRSLPVGYFVRGEQSYFSLDMSQIHQKAVTLKDEELTPVLDEGQMKRWKAVNPNSLMRNRYVRERIATEEDTKDEVVSEIDAERMISAFLYRESLKQKQMMTTVMESRVEDVIRVTNPSEEGRALLRVAARGAAARMAESAGMNLQSWVRGQFNGVKPADVPKRLAGLSNPYFSDRSEKQENPIWTAAIDRALTAEQLALWNAEQKKREAWRVQALSRLTVSEVDQRVGLSLAQREALQPAIEKIVTDYEEDFSSFFSTNWYLQTYYSTIPLAGIKEEELKKLFPGKEMDDLSTRCLANVSQYWEMIENQHKQRAKRR